MKILHLNSNYNTSTLYKHLYKELAEYELEQIVYVPVAKKFEVFKKTLEIEKDTSKIKHIFIRGISKFENRLFFPKIYKMFYLLKKKVDLETVTMVHAHSTFSNGMLAYFIKLLYSKKYIVAFRSTDYQVFKSFKIGEIILKEIMKKSEKIIFINHSYKEEVVDKKFKEFQDKVLIIPNGVDDFWIKNKTLKRREKKETINFISIGYFFKRKNFIYTIELLKKISKLYSVTLTIVGEGDLKSEIENNLKNFPNTKILPWQSKEEIRRLLLENDIFILPSQNETFGLVYIEALSQGMSVIYKKNDGIDGFISKEFGVGLTLEEKKDVEYLNEYLQSLNTKEFNIEKFSWKKIAKKYNEIYLEIGRDNAN